MTWRAITDRPTLDDLPGLDEVLGGDFDTCPRCGDLACSASSRDNLDELTDCYDYICNECGLQWSIIYRMVGVSVRNDVDGSLPGCTWTEFPVSRDQRVPPPDGPPISRQRVKP